MNAETRVQTIRSKYESLYDKFGHSPKSLGWTKGMQEVRFANLVSQVPVKSKCILEIGCGFGEMVPFLRQGLGDDLQYTGIDIVQDFVVDAKSRFGDERREFETMDFLAVDTPFEPKQFDFVLASGIFNDKIEGSNPREHITACMELAAKSSKYGFAFDFLSDRVDYRHAHTEHSNPSQVLELAYAISRRVVLRNDYMPFEFSICVYLEETFKPEYPFFIADLPKTTISRRS